MGAMEVIRLMLISIVVSELILILWVSGCLIRSFRIQEPSLTLGHKVIKNPLSQASPLRSVCLRRKGKG